MQNNSFIKYQNLPSKLNRAFLLASLISAIIGFLLGAAFTIWQVNSITRFSGAYSVYLEHATEQDINRCKQDENCMDINDAKDLCLRSDLGLDAKELSE